MNAKGYQNGCWGTPSQRINSTWRSIPWVQEWQLSLCLPSPRSGAAPEGEGVVPNGEKDWDSETSKNRPSYSQRENMWNGGKNNTLSKIMKSKWNEHILFSLQCFWITTVVFTDISRVKRSHLVMNGPSIGRLYQDLVSQFGEALDVLGSQRCPAFPGIHILSPECHHWLVVETSEEAGSQPGHSRPLHSQHLQVW